MKYCRYHRSNSHQERAPRVNLMHEIESFHLSLLSARLTDGRRVVYQNVDASELCDGRFNNSVHGSLVANVDDACERLTACLKREKIVCNQGKVEGKL